ncbi:hypothetical protein [Kitasatospora sp. NPDC005751]|uniref:hypothetical protein n=1 Tax=Kitasatospora sp. NPDC005751 TaxID=3157064 RepID=UPI0033D14210
MIADQIQEVAREAAMWKRHRSRVCDNKSGTAAIRAAIDEHREWRRIGYVVVAENLTTSDPTAT